ncbi:MAG: hypothetical protein LBR21_00825 [Propionibacteriaceae bacterium]|jgi:hypothetical protein|nr:hypothetical protein [Propionibacteriaceae bacterium]
MACFLVTTVGALASSAIDHSVPDDGQPQRVGLKQKLSWLVAMLWGGSLLLALEHIWHGEVVFSFPFLTAMGSPEDTAVMFREMATTGVGMLAMVLLAWGAMVLAVDRLPKLRAALVRS